MSSNAWESISARLDALNDKYHSKNARCVLREVQHMLSYYKDDLCNIEAKAVPVKNIVLNFSTQKEKVEQVRVVSTRVMQSCLAPNINPNVVDL